MDVLFLVNVFRSHSGLKLRFTKNIVRKNSFLSACHCLYENISLHEIFRFSNVFRLHAILYDAATRFMDIFSFTKKKKLGNVQWQYYAPKTRFMHIIGFNAMNALGNVQTQYYAPKTRFMHIIGFNAMKALGNVQMH